MTNKQSILYGKYGFKTQLAARWAVFFDAIKIDWVYSAARHRDNDDARGVDFYLPFFDSYVWIEPTADITVPIMAEMIEIYKANAALRSRLYIGSPFYDGEKFSYSICAPSDKITKDYAPDKPHNGGWTQCPMCLHFSPNNDWYIGMMDPESNGLSCDYCDFVDRDHVNTNDTFFHKGIIITRDQAWPLYSPALAAAYKAARSAVFQYGPAPIDNT